MDSTALIFSTDHQLPAHLKSRDVTLAGVIEALPSDWLRPLWRKLDVKEQQN